ncbi:NK-tumor recognition protein isoform X2 [Chiloscyllium plagiosum]|uniref:NK-tumor recognition protein isoform X2 n=1 Tax=Chiloscyllium plagiosum TaxID=36176 RepID=UPI001CB7D3EA|nr:NK-tumor recognition protein isoform X2 [Chiloscyllium plagiosum]
MGVKNRPQCYFDVEINRAPVGRIVFELFSDVCPKTCKNFLFLCTGEKGLGKKTRKQLCYKGSTFHRIVKEFMVQGGDFSEGNGRGGESIYGGYFEDENFVLKHDREFLLSMANRGRNTNGSQFFITTKPAPHLDGVHVVFGQVITGFDTIKEIENLKTDAASRPYADVRIIDCGEFVPKSASHVTERRKKVTTSYSSHESETSSDSSTSSKSSDSESETEEEREKRRKRKRKMRSKHSKRRKETRSKKRKISSHQKSHNGIDEEDDKDRESNPKRQKLSVRPEEIPPVPENRFLLRRDLPKPDTEPKVQEAPSTHNDQKPVVSKSGRKIKGRGTMRYRTPSKSRSHTESELDEESSETPPHWKEEMQRVRTYRAASLEKWTKGDKLKSESRKWSDRSASPWSRSWSHDGYYSDDRNRRKSSHYKRTKKERRKIKAKKKSKKQKHSRRHKVHKHKTKETSIPLESSRSLSCKTKSSFEHEKKSPSSASSRHSSESAWSESSTHQSSSASTVSRSYSRSKSRSRSKGSSRSRSRTRSRTRSRSRSRSRTRSRSRSRSRCRSRSRSRSRCSSSSISSRSRSTSRSSSKSRHAQRRSTQMHFENLSQTKLDTSRVAAKENEKNVTLTAPVEAVPAVPLSESPPPSRWRPGQKPWKPSYVRIQEAQAKLSETTPTLSSRDSKCSRDDDLSPSLRKQRRNSDSRRHYNSDRESDRSSTSDYRKSSRSRGFSSRSRSRSYSRSRSRSSSRSRSPTKSPYHESSYSKSSSHSYESIELCVPSSDEKFDKIQKKNPVSNKRGKDQQATSTANHANKDRETGKKYEKEHNVSSSHCSSESESLEYERGKEKVESKKHNVSSSQAESLKKSHSSKKGEGKCERSSKISIKEHATVKYGSSSDRVQRPKKKSSRNKSSERKPATGSYNKDGEPVKKVPKKPRLKSETESETEQSKSSKLQSGTTSEEGEVVQKYDGGGTEGKLSNRRVNSRSEVCNAKPSGSSNSEGSSRQPSVRRSSVASSSSGSARENEKRRKKKVKHKLKSKKKSKSKSTKFKKKSEKKKVKKVPKTKEKFHWQPPLEFGEEEEEETKTDGPGINDVKSKVRNTLSCVGRHDAGNTITNCAASIKGSHPVKENAELRESPTSASGFKQEVELPPKQRKGDSTKAETSAAKPGAAEKANPQSKSVKSTTPDKCTSASATRKNSEKEASASEAGCSKGAKSAGIKSESDNSAEKAGQNKKETNGAEVVQASDINGSTMENSVRTENEPTDSNKWKPLKVLPSVQSASPLVNPEVKVEATESDGKPQGLKIEIKSKNKVKPGSLFDEVRRTARLNQRQRNQETSSEEDSPSRDSNSRSRSSSRGHYRSSSRDRTHSRTRSRSTSRSRSRSRSYSSSYRSRSYSRSRSRRRHSRGHSSHSSSYRSYRSHRTYSRSHSRSLSSRRHRRSRSDSYDSYDSRSRSRSRSYHKSRRSRSWDRSYRSYRSYSRSDRSYSRHRSHSESSRYS